MDLPRFRGGLRTWDRGIWSDGILPSCLVAFFCSSPAEPFCGDPPRIFRTSEAIRTGLCDREPAPIARRMLRSRRGRSQNWSAVQAPSKTEAARLAAALLDQFGTVKLGKLEILDIDAAARVLERASRRARLCVDAHLSRGERHAGGDDPKGKTAGLRCASTSWPAISFQDNSNLLLISDTATRHEASNESWLTLDLILRIPHDGNPYRVFSMINYSGLRNLLPIIQNDNPPF